MKRFIKKIAAVSAGGLMLLSAMGGAIAAGETLSSLPAPFVSNDAWVSTAMVVGSAAGTNDDAARSTLKTYFDGMATAVAAGLGTQIAIEEINLQDNIAGSAGLDTTYDDSDSIIFDDAEISIGGTSYDYHTEVQLSNTADNFDLETSLTSSDDKYEWDPKLEIKKDALKFCYVFDETTQLDNAVGTSATTTNNNPFELDFLGKSYRIDRINSNTSFTAQVGDSWTGHSGEIYTGNGITMEVIAVDATSAVVDFGNDQRSVTEGNTVSEGEVDVYLQTAIAGVGSADEAIATFIIGEDARVTYTDGSKFVEYCSPSDGHGDPDCDSNNPDWVWDIKGLTSNASGSSATTGNAICIENDFEAYNFNKNPAGIGEYYGLPYGFTYIGIDSLNVVDADYMTVDIYTETGNTVDLSTDGEFPTNGIVLTIASSIDEGLVVDQSGLTAAIITTDEKTDEIYLWTNATGSMMNFTSIFYKDSNNVVKYAGNITNADTKVDWGYIDYKRTQGTDMILSSYGHLPDVTGSSDDWWLGFAALNTSSVNDNLWFRVQGANGTTGNYLGFGTTDNSESSEVVWGATIAPSATASTINVLVGSKKYDLLTGYGIKVVETDSSGDNDMFTLYVPGDQVKANVALYAGGAATAVEPVLTTESGASAYDKLILVGGPCVNSLTAQYMGVTYPACESASGITADTAVIKMVEMGGKTALIVAGYEKADTVRGATNVAAGSLTGTEQIV